VTRRGRAGRGGAIAAALAVITEDEDWDFSRRDCDYLVVKIIDLRYRR
jgi:hypothetical protein